MTLIKNRQIVLLALLIGTMQFGTYAHQAGEYFFKAGLAYLTPVESSDDVLSLGEFEIDNNLQLGLNFNYMFTNNLGLELLAATPLLLNHEPIKAFTAIFGRKNEMNN